MPYKLDGKTLPLDRPWTYQEIQYPSNWLRLSTAQDRAELGIVWEADPPTWDQRFYWGYDADGQLIPKDHGELVTLWTANTRTTANTLLTPSDWMVIREADNSTDMDSTWKAWRESIRLAANEKIQQIAATADTDSLAAYIKDAAYATWPADPDQPITSVDASYEIVTT